MKITVNVDFFSKPKYKLEMAVEIDGLTQKFIKVYDLGLRISVAKHDIFWCLAHLSYFPNMTMLEYDELVYKVHCALKEIIIGGKNDTRLVEWPIHIQD